MASAALLDRIDELDGSLETLEQVLKPILDESLHAATRKLPLLDRAKLNVTVVYAIESLLFSYLRLNGVNAKEHEVFKELNRVKSYFEKVKEADEKHATRSVTLNKQAAARMITHSLASNGASDMAQRARQLKELIMAKKSNNNKAAALVVPVSSAVNGTPSETTQADELLDSVAKEMELQDREGSEEGEIDEHTEPQYTLPPKPPAHANRDSFPQRKRKHGEGPRPKPSTGDKADRKARKKAKKAAKGVS